MKPKPFYTFIEKTYARIMDFLKVDKLLTTENIKCKIIYGEVISSRLKTSPFLHYKEEQEPCLLMSGRSRECSLCKG